jgi:hypothetical protein
MFFSLNAKRRVPLNNQSLLKLRQIDNNVQRSNSEINTWPQVKEISSIVKDVITYDIGELSNEVGEPSNDIDLIAPEPQMEEPVIETLSNVVASNNETIEKEPSVKVYESILEPILEEVCNEEEVSGIKNGMAKAKAVVEINKKKKKNGRK